MEVEKEEKTLEFLDVKVRNNGHGNYDFEVFRKKAITNIQVKPNSSHDPNTLRGIFKGFVHRAYKICSEHHVKDEVDFLINVFKENGYDEKILKKLCGEVKNKINAPTVTSTVREENETTLQTISLPWIPGVSPQLKKRSRKQGIR